MMCVCMCVFLYACVSTPRNKGSPPFFFSKKKHFLCDVVLLFPVETQLKPEGKLVCIWGTGSACMSLSLDNWDEKFCSLCFKIQLSSSWSNLFLARCIREILKYLTLVLTFICNLLWFFSIKNRIKSYNSHYIHCASLLPKEVRAFFNPID